VLTFAIAAALRAIIPTVGFDSTLARRMRGSSLAQASAMLALRDWPALFVDVCELAVWGSFSTCANGMLGSGGIYQRDCMC
jgi:hypothetical protein